MKSPPPELDGARVLWWSWSGDTPFGELFGADDDDRWIHGFAVCRLATGSIYRFSCNKNWEVVQDSQYNTEDEAKASIPTNYDSTRVVWLRYGE